MLSNKFLTRPLLSSPSVNTKQLIKETGRGSRPKLQWLYSHNDPFASQKCGLMFVWFLDFELTQTSQISRGEISLAVEPIKDA